jgi:hypothetical protein
MDKHIIFYSWQSDRPNPVNRGFIQKALENAARSIRDDETIQVEPRVDSDTSGVGGAPDIARTILSKIERCDIFVCDVSIINSELIVEGDKKYRATPNPNVMLELGYAIKAVSEQRIILMMNTAYGGPEMLPFDLRGKRVVQYNMPEEAEHQHLRAEVRRGLERQLEYNLRTIFAALRPSAEDATLTLAEQFDRLLSDPGGGRTARKLVLAEADLVRAGLNDKRFDALREKFSYDLFRARMRDYEELTADLRSLFILGCADTDATFSPVWADALSRVVNAREPTGSSDELIKMRLYPAVLFLYAGGLAATAAAKYEHLRSMLRDASVRDFRNPAGAPLPHALVHARLIEDHVSQGVLGSKNEYAPLSSHLYELLREPLRGLIPDDYVYADTFVRFEYLFALASAVTCKAIYGYAGVPYGSYLWEIYLRNKEHHIVNLTNRELEREKDGWLPLKAGLFDGPLESFLAFKREADGKLIGLIQDQYPMWTYK